MTGAVIAPVSSKVMAASLAAKFIAISGLNALLTRAI
jgi:hypothetical protein